jgi:hypothetical protein
MPFSASTCLTDLGTTLLGGTFNIYSNVDNYTSPFQTNVSYTSLFGPSCPYVMGNVPNGTNTIRIIDTLTKCCATIELLSNDLCTTCDLEFDSYQTNNIGRVVAGDLIGSCDDEITEYRIYWYGPDSTTNVAFTSGYGSSFSPYDLTHPLVGVNSPMVQAGEYIPVIDKVNLNGLNYSQTGGTGYIQAELECFNGTTVNVSPFTCDNGTVVGGDYTHRVNFSAAAAGTTPLTLNSTFDLEPTTDYFSWKFKAESIPDSLKITFYGSSYSEPIILEYWVVGNNITSSNINLLTFPKSGRTNSYLSKVTSLTSLTRSPGDYLILEVIPNQNNTQTNWDFYFTCMDSFDCDLCLYDYLNTPYKIKSSSITGITGSCSSIRVNYDLSGCTSNSIQNSDIYKYQVTSLFNINTTQFYNVEANNSTGLLNVNTPNILDWNQTSCSLNYGFNTSPQTCSPSNTNTIKFIKENTGPSGQGVIKMEFSSLSDLIHYKSSYDLALPYSGTPSNPSNPNYYRYFTLYIPKNATPSTQCGDNTTVLGYDIHYSSVVTTGTTGGIYTLNITMPTISNGLPPFDPCDIDCQYYVNTYIPTNINGSSTGVTNVENFTTNTGSKYVRPFGSSLQFTVQPPSVASGSTNQGYYYLNNFLNSTVPFSGSSSPYTQIPSLSALTCNNFTSIGTSGGIQQFVSVYHYRVELTDPNNVKSFRILAAPIVNGVSSNIFSDVVATVINGVLQLPTNPLYTF